MTLRFDPVSIGHMPGGEAFRLSGGRWVRPDGGPVDLYHFHQKQEKKIAAPDWSKEPEQRAYLSSRYQLKKAAEASARKAALAWGAPGGFAAAREDVRAVCENLGVAFPESKHGIYPELLRTEAPEWWGRQLKKTDRRTYEYQQIKRGIVHNYCSKGMLEARQNHKKEVKQLLERLVAVCEDGDGNQQEIELSKLAEKSNANPVVRRAELMIRIRGFEEYAKRQGHLPFFFTFTCPSKFHRNSGDRWNGASPREAQAYLCKVWARCRAALARKGIDLYGFRVAEPHKDGCPHWHAVFWFKNYAEKRIGNKIIREHFLAMDGKEPGAQKQRVKIVDIADVGGSATGYIAKYICKNVDGVFDDPELGATSFDAHDRDGRKLRDADGKKLDSVEAAQRVDAWASCWAIRQFQQIGGPRVGVWRELRRLEPMRDDTLHGAVLEPMREAADRSQWDLFTELSVQQAASGNTVRVWTDTSMDLLAKDAAKVKDGSALLTDEAVLARLNKWQEPALRKVRGLEANLMRLAVKVKTRFLQWTLMLKAAADTKIERAMIEQDRREQLESWWDVFQVEGLGRQGRKKVEALGWLLGFEAAAPPKPLEFCQ